MSRDHRDDGNAIAGVFYALPISLALWLVILAGVFVSPLVPLVVFGGLVVGFCLWEERK